MLAACAYNRQRLYLFFRQEPSDTDEVIAGRCFSFSYWTDELALHPWPSCSVYMQL